MPGRAAIRVSAGGATVEVGPELGQFIEGVLDAAAGTLRTALEQAVVDLATAAEGAWYDQVSRRTGQSGQLETGMVLTETEIRATVRSTDPRRAKNGLPVVYYVHRPGPTSTIKTSLTREEYSELMRALRAGRTMPSNLVAAEMVGGRPLGVSRVRPNPKASDGKYLVPELLTKPAQLVALRLVRTLGPQIAAAARRR